MKIELSQSLQQQQVLAPQMILSMDILLLPSLDLEQRLREEFAQNPALEIADRTPSSESPPPPGDSARVGPETPQFDRLGAFESDPSRLGTTGPRRRSGSAEGNAKHEALQNTEGRPPGLKDSLVQQVHLKGVEGDLRRAAEDIINNLDHRGYLVCPEPELRESMQAEYSSPTYERALDLVRDLDPPGVGAEDLSQCLLLQLERDAQSYPLEERIIREHLLDLGQNRIPKIAKELGATLDDVKDAIEIIASLDPAPGGRLESERTLYVRPDVIIEVVGGEITVRVDSSNVPDLKVSDSCREILKQHRGQKEVTGFLRKKVESAQWIIQAVQQRQRTIRDIAVAMADFQREFMISGPEKLRAMKMQAIADIVGVHISTISRAIKGKYMQTPWGMFEMRYFFTGGVETEAGELESRRNVYRRIGEIIEAEDKASPLSDSRIAGILRTQGLQIARRTVSKYREQQEIPSSRLRKAF